MPESLLAQELELAPEDRQPVRHRKLKQANQLTVARYLLGETEQKMLLYAIAMIDPKKKQFARYRIEVTSYAAACGITGHAAYNQLWDAAKSIATKPLIILNHQEPDGKVIDLVTHWFAEVKRGTGYIEVTFPPSLSAYLVDPQQRFFRYEWNVPLKFRGEYTIRLYLWLKSWQFRGSSEIPVADLRVVLGLDEWDGKGNVVRERLPAFADVKKWALQPALKQINALSDISVGMREKKVRGTKRVESIVFTILDNPAYIPDPTIPKLPGARVAAPVDPAVVELLARVQSEFGLTVDQARQIIGQHGVERVKEKMAVVAAGTHQNAAASLLLALKKDWQPPKRIDGKKTPARKKPAPAPPEAPVAPLTEEEKAAHEERLASLRRKKEKAQLGLWTPDQIAAEESRRAFLQGQLAQIKADEAAQK